MLLLLLLLQKSEVLLLGEREREPEVWCVPVFLFFTLLVVSRYASRHYRFLEKRGRSTMK